jgi:phosphoserine phosphatase RsbU/P
MTASPSTLRLSVLAALSAAILWYLTGTPLGPLSRLAVLVGGTALLTLVSERLGRRPPEPEAESAEAGRGSIADELALGFELQRRFLPAEKEVRFEGLHLAGRCVPARGVSGDTFDFGALEDGRSMLLLADVAGKGIPAALLMAVFHSSFRSRIAVSADLVPILRMLNDQIHALGGPNRYVTAFCGVFDRQSGLLRYVNAGHYPPLLCRGGQIEELHTGGMPLGIFQGVTYQEGIVPLELGDLLVVYSDGVIEAVNLAGEDFGFERLVQHVRQNVDRPVSHVRDALFHALDLWNDDFLQEDDITVLVVRREESPG